VSFAAPLSAVDRVEVLRRDDGRAVELSADKTIDPDDPYMPAHFPGFTIYPGVFIVETVLQAVALAGGASDRHVPTLAGVRDLRFLAPLLGNDTLSCSVSITPAEPPEVHDVVAEVQRRDGRVAARMDCQIRFDAQGPGTR
jgi:3-hydroxyacyl-[acyl-carrier-protein] dehydratase